MPIEFRCTQCDKLLRTPDDTAGKQAKCPECGAVLAIPSPAAAPPAGVGPGVPPPPPPSAPAPGSPFAPGAAPGGAAAGSPFDQAGESVAAPGPSQPTIVDLGDIFSRTWEIFKPNWGMCLLVIILVIVLNVVVAFGIGFATEISKAGGDAVMTALVSMVGNLVATAFQIWIGIGQALFFLKIARGQQAEIGDVFAGGPYFLRILGASTLFGLMIMAGTFLCIVPGIILALMFWPFYFLIVDRNVGVFDAFGLARDFTAGNKATVLLIWLVSLLLFIASLIPCGLGLLVSIPYFALMYPVIYLTMTGQPTAGPMHGAPSPL